MYKRVAGDGIQVHGAVGFTWDHDLNLYFKRAKTSEIAFGDGRYHRERVAAYITGEDSQ
jgi:alkylation response protein AidB-like acyl-CoA dehydrogenase